MKETIIGYYMEANSPHFCKAVILSEFMQHHATKVKFSCGGAASNAVTIEHQHPPNSI